jgi:hypothetical protein
MKPVTRLAFDELLDERVHHVEGRVDVGRLVLNSVELYLELTGSLQLKVELSADLKELIVHEGEHFSRFHSRPRRSGESRRTTQSARAFTASAAFRATTLRLSLRHIGTKHIVLTCAGYEGYRPLGRADAWCFHA